MKLTGVLRNINARPAGIPTILATTQEDEDDHYAVRRSSRSASMSTNRLVARRHMSASKQSLKADTSPERNGNKLVARRHMSTSKQSLKADSSPERTGNSPWIRKFSLRRSLKHRAKSSESLAAKEVGCNLSYEGLNVIHKHIHINSPSSKPYDYNMELL